jgi:hypothetical protein
MAAENKRLDRILEFLKTHPVQKEIQAYRRAKIEGIIQRQWKKEELAAEKRQLSVLLYQEIKDFERKTGLKLTGIRIKRNKQEVESVIVKVDMTDISGQ